jgi:hypothetical protein
MQQFEEPNSEFEILKATCFFKQHKFSATIKVLTSLKRNQLSSKLKITCFRMRAKVFRRMGQYDKALNDLQVAYALMST